MSKILLFTDNLGAGGAQRQLVGLAVLLKNKGFNIKVCTYQHSDFYKEYLDNEHIENIVIENATNKRKRIWSVTKYLKKEQPDWVIAYQEIPSLIACIAKIYNNNYHLIVSERTTTQKVTIKDKLRFNLYRFADAIVPNSYTQERFLLNRYPWMKLKLKTITNFVDLDYFSFTKKLKSDLPLIIVVASIIPVKNTHGLIEAINILIQKKIPLRLEWYGITEDSNNEYLCQCKNLISKYHLDNYINLLEKNRNIKEKYQVCDFLCLPSFYEGTPNVICEALASGRPIICSNVCDNHLYVKEGENGFLFNPNNSYDIAAKIEQALKITDAEYKSISIRNRESAEKLLSKDVFIEKYLQIITK